MESISKGLGEKRRTIEKQRTIKQNKALWLYFEMLAEELNNAGLDIRAVLKPEVNIPWGKQTVHDFLWQPVQKIALKKESTASLSTKEVDRVYDIVNRHTSNLGVSVPFPNQEDTEEYLKSLK